MKKQEGWINITFNNIQHQSYGYLFKDLFLQKRLKNGDKFLLWMVGDFMTKKNILEDFYDTL